MSGGKAATAPEARAPIRGVGYVGGEGWFDRTTVESNGGST